MRFSSLMMILTLLLAPSIVGADDPLDRIDGTEGWDDIDTSAVDEEAAWRQWREDLARWEAGRARLAAERARMAELREQLGHESDVAVAEIPPEEQDHQARIDAARQTTRAGGPTERDADGQAIDDERPWSRR